MNSNPPKNPQNIKGYAHIKMNLTQNNNRSVSQKRANSNLRNSRPNKKAFNLAYANHAKPPKARDTTPNPIL